MRFWTTAPEPDSLEEALATAVIAWDDLRSFRYMGAIVKAAMAGPSMSGDAAKDIDEYMEKLREDFFIKGPKEETIDDEEAAAFKKLMEQHVVKVDVDRMREGAGQSLKPEEQTVKQKMVFTDSPKGDFYE